MNDRYEEIDFSRYGVPGEDFPGDPGYTGPSYEELRIADYMRALPAKWQGEHGDGDHELGSGLFFTGPVGVGKTYEAAGVAVAAIRASKRVGWVSTAKWLYQMRESFNGGERAEAVRDLARKDVLVIDDIGAESPTDWAKEILYVLVNSAYENKTPMVVTSNLTGAQLAQALGARLVDRLVEVCRPVHMTGKSRRAAKGREAGA